MRHHLCTRWLVDTNRVTTISFKFPAHAFDEKGLHHFLFAVMSATDLQSATDDFHLKLHALLHRQGVFQVMQHNLPSNPELFLEAHEMLIRSHAEFIQAHNRIVDLRCAMVRAQSCAGVIEQHQSAPVLPILQLTPERKLPSPPMLTRLGRSGSYAGCETPIRGLARRALFQPEWVSPDMECKESLDQTQDSDHANL